MDTQPDCIVIGAGQAGLAVSHCLRAQGVRHVVLERRRIGERWRSERWDSFRLLSPNWQTRLPGHHYRGPDPDGFMTGGEVATLLERYGQDAPVRTGIDVTAALPHDGGWLVRTGSGSLWAEHVVIATGHLTAPRTPAVASALPADIRQLHSSEFRSAAELPPGGVLVVGAGPSGQQIAADLAGAGRRVHLAVGGHKNLPRRYRGQDTYWWMDRLGMLSRRVDTLPDAAAARRTPNAVLAGGRADLNLHQLVQRGIVPRGRLTGVDGATLHFADDLAASLHAADANAARFCTAVDDHVREHGLDAPPQSVPRPTTGWANDTARTLDLTEEDINTVIWATGFSSDYTWVKADVFDAVGDPIHRRGVTSAPGLAFMGLRWQHRRSSHFLDGVGRDAEHLALRIAVERDAGVRVAA
jgi:putative flavoprotein involved in K+ transport